MRNEQLLRAAGAEIAARMQAAYMYNYQTERSKIFTEEGQRIFLAVRDRANELIVQAGAVSMQHATTVGSGDSWFLMACVDRLVELKELREITGPNTAGQDRVFVWGPK